MIRLTMLVLGLVGVLLAGRYCNIVPSGSYAYLSAAAGMERIYWWLWPSVWMVFGLSHLIARCEKGSGLANCAGVLGLSLLIRVVVLAPVAYALALSKSPLPTMALHSHAWLQPGLVLATASQTGSAATALLAWFAGSAATVALGLLLQKVYRMDNPQTWFTIVAYTVALQFAAGLRAVGFSVAAVAILTKVLLIPLMERYDRRQLAHP